MRKLVKYWKSFKENLQIVINRILVWHWTIRKIEYQVKNFRVLQEKDKGTEKNSVEALGNFENLSKYERKSQKQNKAC